MFYGRKVLGGREIALLLLPRLLFAPVHCLAEQNDIVKDKIFAKKLRVLLAWVSVTHLGFHNF